MLFLTTLMSGMLLIANAGPSPVPTPSAISPLLKPSVLKAILEEREIATKANVEGTRYSFSVSFLVHAPLAKTVLRLTEFEAYERFVPYVDEARYNSASHILKLRGSIWKYMVATDIRFTTKSDRWLAFEMVAGHFKGMRGEMIFESLGEKGTIVLVRGEQIAQQFPPKFILEQGAQIVFGVTGRRMRSYVEAEPTPRPSSGAPSYDPEIPRPQRRLKPT